ncbi:J domain-containing protein [Algibacter sp. PT7-4]|uniref:J domain-containing protein n=1 Tax=Algibacter ulvanivorans TaxID=3400999 RepID=UPI003AAA83AA
MMFFLHKIQVALPFMENEMTKQAIENNNTYFTSFWFWVALLELLIIGFLIFKYKGKQNRIDSKNFSKDKFKEAQAAKIDMDNLVGSINGSKKIYKELSKVCHPDRFVNTDKQPIAETIFQDITKHRRDLEKLIELKYEAQTKLGVKFKN